MNLQEAANKYGLTEDTIKNWIKVGHLEYKIDYTDEDIQNVINKKSHSRKIKKKSIQKSIPKSYLKSNKSLKILQDILNFTILNNYDLNKIIYFISLSLIGNKEQIIISELKNLFGSHDNDLFIDKFLENQDIRMFFEEDILGAVYMSLLSIGERSTKGVYYTPSKAVTTVIDDIDYTKINENTKIIDPACGSGNFLITITKKLIDLGYSSKQIIQMLHGTDIDSKALFIAKLNIFLILKDIDFHNISFKSEDFLFNKSKYDLIIGNPPWGVKFDNNYKKILDKNLFIGASKYDSFVLFIYNSIENLNFQGNLIFVLPESFTNISRHKFIREICQNYFIKKISIMGREFSEVVTPVLIFNLLKANKKNKSMLYNDQIVDQKIFDFNPDLNFLIPRDLNSSSILRKLEVYPCKHLTSGVKYALGIVTGNNKIYIKKQADDNDEKVVSGYDLEKYFINDSLIENYINKDLSKYQQVAPEYLYRTKNKIVYNFIGKNIKFAIDSSGYFTLNSANFFVLSSIWDPYYVTAILNSRVTQLYYSEIFKTHKLLRKNIENFKIFDFSEDIKKKLSALSRELHQSKSLNNYESIENIIYSELKLNSEERNYLITKIK